MQSQRHLQLTLALVGLAAGCGQRTGLLLAVAGPSGTTSVAAGVATLDFVTAHQSWCERFIPDSSASHTRVDVRGRDLGKRPYELLVQPTHFTHLADTVVAVALAYDAQGKLLGWADFASPFKKGEVLRYQEHLTLFGRADAGVGYVAGDGCICLPGVPWIGNGSGKGCDVSVIPSIERFSDTAGCELPDPAHLPVGVCDGHIYGAEAADRMLPCWASDDAGACRVGLRGCADHNGVAWKETCSPDANAPMAPAAMCDRYHTCEATACGDVMGCVRAATPAAASLRCTLRMAATGKPMPCAGGEWRAALPVDTSAACLGAVVGGTVQPPFTLGFAVPKETVAQPLSDACPLTLVVDGIDGADAAAVPDTHELDLVVGDRLVHVILSVVRECGTGMPSLLCSAA